MALEGLKVGRPGFLTASERLRWLSTDELIKKANESLEPDGICRSSR
jgi:hypothetical protein